MPSAKDHVRRILDDLPEDATLEDIQYRNYVQKKVEDGLRDVEAGRLLSQQEAESRMRRWLEPSD